MDGCLYSIETPVRVLLDHGYYAINDKTLYTIFLVGMIFGAFMCMAMNAAFEYTKRYLKANYGKTD